MNETSLRQFLERNIKSNDLELLLSHFTLKKFNKGDKIIREGQVCCYLFYIEKGLAKLVTNNNDREFVMHFFDEGYHMSVIDSFTLQQPSTYEIVALEDCELWLLHHDNYEKLCSDNHSIDILFRKITQVAASNMLSRISTRLKYDATYRYELFLKQTPQLIQRISLGDLANYLGITQASLSKIRAKK